MTANCRPFIIIFLAFTAHISPFGRVVLAWPKKESVTVTWTAAWTGTWTSAAGIGLVTHIRTDPARPFLISHFSFYISHFTISFSFVSRRKFKQMHFCGTWPTFCLWPKVNVCVCTERPSILYLLAKRKPFPWLTWLSLASRFSCLTKQTKQTQLQC